MPEAEQSTRKSMDAIMALCKRRGFIFQASEIYGGINGFWDYGPLGAQLKKNLRDAWWEDMILRPCWGRPGPNQQHVRCLPLETCIIQHPKVWEASGHVAGFNDPMVDCKECNSRFRADHVIYGRTWLWGDELPEDGHIDFDQLEQQVANQQPSHNCWCLTGDSIEEIAKRVRTQTKARKVSFEVRESAPPDVGPALQIWFLKIDGKWYRWAASLGDKLDESARCPNCGGEMTAPRPFNLMFPTVIGATGDWENNKAYLRPETAQGIFVQFKNVVDTTRVKMPFGIGNVGKSFRNEVTPRNFTFRSREFEQMELEFFCHPDESKDWYRFWRDYRMEWWQSLGLAGDNLILREHDPDELSHYSVGTSDVEYRFPFTAPGFGELEGIAHRGCYDLTQHQQHSGAKMEFHDTDRGEILPNGSRKGERYIPHCIEPAAGLDRGVLAILCEAYTRDESRPSPEFLKLHPRLAPVKAGVFPLVNKDGMPDIAGKLHADLSERLWRHGAVEFDAKQSIGKRYARMDEAGCPYCFTVDGQTREDNTVTVRHRDTGDQERIAIDSVVGWLTERLGL